MHSYASRHLGEHLPNPLDGLAADGARRKLRLLQTDRARLAGAHMQARQHRVPLGRVEAHHAQRLLRTRVGAGAAGGTTPS